MGAIEWCSRWRFSMWVCGFSFEKSGDLSSSSARTAVFVGTLTAKVPRRFVLAIRQFPPTLADRRPDRFRAAGFRIHSAWTALP